MVGMGVLKSHAPMGAVRVSCVSGCACTPAEFDTHWDQKISLRQLLYFNAHLPIQTASCASPMRSMSTAPRMTALLGRAIA